MSARTAAEHCPAELAFVDADDTINIVHYAAPSASRPGVVNTVALDILTGETHCTCKAAETGRECWHVALVQAAWDAHPAREQVRYLDADQLRRFGRKLANCCAVYRRRCWRTVPADRVGLLAARSEYKRRHPAAALAVEAA